MCQLLVEHSGGYVVMDIEREEEITPPAVTSRSGAGWEETHMDDRNGIFRYWKPQSARMLSKLKAPCKL